MGKISNAIQMLNYLNTGNKYTVRELSEKIGITERMVRYYKVELEQAGIPIETFMGPNGGYYILNIKNQYNHFNSIAWFLFSCRFLAYIFQNLFNSGDVRNCIFANSRKNLKKYLSECLRQASGGCPK